MKKKKRVVSKVESNNVGLFRDCEVKAKSVADFLARYYRPERYYGRGDEYAACLLTSHERDFSEFGYDVISHWDSVTGKTVSFFGVRK